MLGHVNRAETALFPPTINELVPDDHVARFYVRAAERLDVSALEAQYSATEGRKGYPPTMLLALWLYGYMAGVTSSRKLEAATHERIDFMYIAAGEHPDHATLASFRKRNTEAFKAAAVSLLHVLVQAGVVNLDAVALDGTKLKAYAAREKSLTAAQARKRLGRCRELIETCNDRADQADTAASGSDPSTAAAKVDDDELTRLMAEAQRLEALALRLEAEDAAQLAADQAAYDAKVAKREAGRDETGKAPRGRPPKPPGDEPSRWAREHETDPDAQLMKTRDGIMPAYNAQAGVDVDTQLIVHADVTDQPTDHGQIDPALTTLNEVVAVRDAVAADAASDAVDDEGDEGDKDQAQRVNLLADAGYYSDDNVVACEKAKVNAYIAKGRDGRAALPKGPHSAAVVTMVDRMATKAGKALYGQRKSTIETTFGCIKDAMGFRYPTMRGLVGIQTEWQLVCMAWNLKRLFSLGRTSLF